MSFGELVLLAIIAVVALGKGRLPQAGRVLGKGIRNFHRGLREAHDAIDEPAIPAGRPRRLID